MKWQTLAILLFLPLICLWCALAIHYVQPSAPPTVAPAPIPVVPPVEPPTSGMVALPYSMPLPHLKGRPGTLPPMPLDTPDPNAVAIKVFPRRDPWVTVDWSLKLDPKTKALYQRMATLVSGYKAIPKDRFNYYAAVNNPPDYLIHGWGGMLNKVEPMPKGGYLLTVRVHADLSVTASRLPMMYSSDYSEQYSVDVNDKLEYVGFLDPKGWAGKMPEVWAHP